MKQMATMQTLATLAGLASVAAMILFIGSPGAITAFTQQPSLPGTETFPPLSVTTDVNARLHVVNTKFVNDSNVMPCAVVLRILDSDGNLLAQERKLLRPRQAAFIDVAGRDVVVGRGGLRTEVWAAISPDGPRCAINTSFELIDAISGQTLVALGGPDTSQWRRTDDAVR